MQEINKIAKYEEASTALGKRLIFRFLGSVCGRTRTIVTTYFLLEILHTPILDLRDKIR